MIKIYTQKEKAKQWLTRYEKKLPVFSCVLGFTETGLIPGISAAGATPSDRQYTAVADAEFLINGPANNPTYGLPPLDVGISPVFITRAVVHSLKIPIYLFDAGLPCVPSVPVIAVGGKPANCLTTGCALPEEIVTHLFAQGQHWGEYLAKKAGDGYLIFSECVVGGTTTALALLTGLGISAHLKVNSSHPNCNHQQKWSVVQTGLQKAGLLPLPTAINPLEVVAAVGDPMQIFVAAMALSASRFTGVMLAGGTQMLAVYHLMQTLVSYLRLKADLEQVVVGTTRWVAEDPTGDTVGLAQAINNIPLLATELDFSESIFTSMQAYEQGYVKEGVGAGGCAIAAHLYAKWTNQQLLNQIELLAKEFLILNSRG